MALNFLKILFRNENVWLSFANIGIFSGIFTAIVAKLFHLDFVSYFGALFTARPSGKLNFVVGVFFCVLLAASSIYLLAIAFMGFKLVGVFFPMELSSFSFLGFVQSVVSGLCILILDFINPCVRNKTIEPMGFMALKHGVKAFFGFILMHVVYASVCFEIFEKVFVKY